MPDFQDAREWKFMIKHQRHHIIRVSWVLKRNLVLVLVVKN